MKKNKKYFTLTELVIVLAVMFVSFSLSGFFISKAKRDASAVKCAENLFSMGKATFKYVAENKGFLPYASYGETNWKTAISPYLKDASREFLCPADKNKMPLYMQKDPFYKGRISYSANHYVIDIKNIDNNRDDYISTRKLSSIDGPDTVILYAENHNGKNTIGGALSVSWDQKGKYLYPDAAQKGYHGNGMNNYLLLDGGVEFYSYRETRFPMNFWLLKYGKTDL